MGALSGTVIVMGSYCYGDPLTATYIGGESVTWQWYRADASGNETPIPGATQTTYTVAVEDVGCSLYAEATAADDNYTGSVRGVTPYPMQRRSITVKADTPPSSQYGEEIRTLTASVSAGSLVGDDTLDEIVTISTTATRNSTVGTYPITVTPKGHPGYDVTCIGGTYTITKAQVTVHTPDTGTITYGESLSEISLSDGWEWVDGDIKPEVSDSSKTGYPIRKKIDDDVNYDWDRVAGYDPESKILSNTAVVTVLPKPLAAEMVSGVANAYVYTGGAIEPAVTVQDGEALVPDTDYTVTYGANTTVAEGGTITVKGMGNYTGELVIEFSITQADPIYTLPEGLRACVGHTLADVGLPDGWAWEDGALSVGAAGSHQFAAVFTPEDTQNYNIVKAELTLIVGEHTGGTATCTEKAVCTACGEEYGDLAAHTPETVPATAATCTQTGLTEGSKCSVCGEMLKKQETIPALNHDYTNVGPVWNWIGFASATASLPCTRKGCGHVEVVMAVITNEVTAAATCEGEGVRTYTATATFGGKTFTDSKTEVIPMAAHTSETIPGKAATCTSTGLTDGEKCSVCGTILTAQTVIPMAAHTSETIPGKAATCTSTGLTDGEKCSVCGTILTAQSVISAKGHTPGGAATCTTAQRCIVCGETLVKAKGHTAGAPVRENEKAPTCTEEGSYDEAVYCTVCEEELSRKTLKIEAAGHSPELVAGKAATCTESGLTDGEKCSVCGETLQKQETIPALGHSPELVAGKDATCTESGLTDGEKCSVCGETLQEQETIPALGHDLGEWTVTREPTHSAEGEEQRICSRCGKEETQAIPVLEGLSGGETAGVAVGSAVGTMLLAYGVLALLFKKGIVTGAFFIKIFPFIKP